MILRYRLRLTSVALLLCTALPGSAQPGLFPTPHAAVDALLAALNADNRDAVLRIFGPENGDIYTTGIPEEDRKMWGDFLRDYKSVHRIASETPERATLLTGRDSVAFPAPLVLKGGAWSFDSEAAREELRFRRIGANELAVIAIMRTAGAVQGDYRSRDHDGDGVREFAASILSTPGARDGLYWPDEPGTASSPFSASIARASLTGYREGAEDLAAEPYGGYYFQILQGQGTAAPGGAYSYMVNGNMVGGFALLAVPAAYGDSGLMSFLVGEGGVVYEADLGESTLEKAAGMNLFDPDGTWSIVDLDIWN